MMGEFVSSVLQPIHQQNPDLFMSLRFSHLSWWLQTGKKHQKPKSSNASSLETSLDSGQLDSDNLKILRRPRRKRNTRKEKKIDKEYDVVLVPSDGGCVSGSESDDSDYSIGWLEPHGPGFPSDDDKDNSFAVLVRCYGHNQDVSLEGMKDNNVLSAIVKIPDSYPSESRKYMEQLLGSLKSGSHSER